MKSFAFYDELADSILQNFKDIEDLVQSLPSARSVVDSLLHIYPENCRPTIQSLNGCIDKVYRHSTTDTFLHSKSRRTDIWTLSIIPDSFDVHLPIDRKTSSEPWRLIYIHSEYFESLLGIHSSVNDEKLISSVGALDYLTVKNIRQYQTQRWQYFSYVPLNSEIAERCHKSIGFLDGAYAVIITKPKVSKKEVLKSWTTALINADILGQKYIAAIGKGISNRSINIITDCAYKKVLNELFSQKHINITKFRNLQQILKDRDLDRLLELLGQKFRLFAIGNTENLWGIPIEKWKTPGYSPVVAIIYLIKDKYIREKYFSIPQNNDSRSAKVFRIFVKGGKNYGLEDHAVTSLIIHEYAVDFAIKITGIMDKNDTLLAKNNEELPHNLVRYVNAKEAKKEKRVLKGAGKLFNCTELNSKGLDATACLNNADILVLTSGHYDFKVKDAKAFGGKVVVEASPYAASPKANEYLIKKGILFIPYTVVNIGWSYALRLMIIHGFERTPEYNVKEHIVSGIIGYTLSEMWTLMNRFSHQNNCDFINLTQERNNLFSQKFANCCSQFHSIFGCAEDNYSCLSPDADKILNSLSKIQQNRFKPILKGIRDREGVPYIFAMKNSVFRDLWGRRIQDENSPEQLLEMLELPSRLDRPKRRLAAFLIGHANFSIEEQNRIIQQFSGKLYGKNPDHEYRIRAEVAKSLGRMGNQLGLKNLIDSLADPTEHDPEVRRWVYWAIQRLNGIQPIKWRDYVLKAEKNLAKAEKEIQPFECENDGIDSTVLSTYQKPYHILAKAQFRSAILYQLSQDMEKAIKLFNLAIHSFTRSEMTGGQLPFVTQQIIAEIYYEEAILNSDKPAIATNLIKSARQTILSNSVPAFARNLLQGGHHRDLDRSLEEEFFEVTFVLKNYRIYSLEKFFIIEKFPPDMAKHIAIAIDEFLCQKEIRWENHLTLSTPNGLIFSIPDRQCEGKICQSDLKKLKMIDRAQEIYNSYKTSSLKPVIDMFIEDDLYLKLYLLAASEMFYQFPEIAEQIIRTISERDQHPIPEDILYAPKLTSEDLSEEFANEMALFKTKYDLDVESVLLMNNYLYNLFDDLGIIC